MSFLTRTIKNVPLGGKIPRLVPFSVLSVRTVSSSSGIGQYFAPYPTLPKIASTPAPLVNPQSKSTNSSFYLMSNMVPPHSAADLPPSKRWESISDTNLRAAQTLGNVSMGRSVPVLENDVSYAYRRLHMILSRNRVRQELFLQRRYEKPSDRERRLKSERHRRRFAAWIRKKVQLVSSIRGQS